MKRQVKNSYIHTCSISEDDYNKSIFDITGSVLISLIGGINGKSFGYNSVIKFAEKTLTFLKNHSLTSDKTFKMLDSGGYSIIAGDVEYNDASRFIEVYHYGIEHLYKDFDIVFSLDVPIFLKTPSVNTRKVIERLNRLSLEQSIEMIKLNPELKHKWNFILQWKLAGQFEIWNKLYEELEIYKYHDAYGVGGMVGLTKLANLKFAPFIGPVFWAVDKHIKHHEETAPLLIHLLGVYNPLYRFCIYVTEKLLNSIYPMFDTTITYDTINWTRTAMFNCRSGMDIMFYDDVNNTLNKTHSTKLSDGQLDTIYGSNLRDTYKDQLSHIEDKDNKLDNTTMLVPANIYSNIAFDNFMKDFIDRNNLVDIITNPKTKWNAKKYHLMRIIKPGLLETNYFSSMQIDYIMESLRLIYVGINIPIDDFMSKFIKKLQLPFDLG